MYISVRADDRPTTTPDGMPSWRDVVGSDEEINITVDRMAQSFGAMYIG